MVQVGTVADLQEDVRHKTYRKRPLNSLCWQLGEGFKIGVRLYAVIQPARKGGVSGLAWAVQGAACASGRSRAALMHGTAAAT